MTTARRKCEARTQTRDGFRQCYREAKHAWVTDRRTGRFVRDDVDEYGAVPAGVTVHTCTQHTHGEATR